VARFAAGLAQAPYTGMGYTGDDYSGLLSPAMYRAFAVPCHQRLSGTSEARFMHSELLRAEHLRLPEVRSASPSSTAPARSG
jgi:hypothetical protein